MSIQTQAETFYKIIGALCVRRQIRHKIVAGARGARHLSLSVRLADSLELDKAVKLAEPLALASGSRAVIAERQAGLVVYQFELSERYWQSYTRADLSDMRAVGLGEKRAPILFDLDPPHALVAGTTGAGKSETIKSAVVSLAQTHTPADLNLILIDPHSEYTELDNLAHLVMPRATGPDGIATAFSWAANELRYRKAEGIKNGPKLVIAVDEAAADEVLASEANLAVIRSVASEGRKFGLHAIVGTQKPSHKKLPDILDKLNNKWVGRVDDATMSAKATGQAGLEAHKLTGKGDFLHVNGPVVKRLQVAMATRSDFDALPRAEVRPIEVGPVEILEPDSSEEKTVGRPNVELNARDLAVFLLHGLLGRDRASRYGVSRTSHAIHADFYRQTLVELAKLILEEYGEL